LPAAALLSRVVLVQDMVEPVVIIRKEERAEAEAE
jgi:hypothetical protein